MTNTLKNIIKKEVLADMGVSYDTNIVIEALIMPDSTLHSLYQVRMFKNYVKRYDLNLEAVHQDYYWQVI